MKYLLKTLLLFAISVNVLGQISVMPMNVEGFNEAPFEFIGERVIAADRVDTDSTKNIFLFTKTFQGAIPDTLYAQQFQKINDVWSLVKDTAIVSDETIVLLNNRKGFFDNEGSPVAFFTYYTGIPSEHLKSSVNMISFYSGSVYSLSEHAGEGTITSPNFLALPSFVTNKLFDYWNKLDKWKRD